MEYTSKQILEACKKQKGKNPMEIFKTIARMDFIRMHGPEHHILDGACILTAFYNAGGMVDLESGLERIATEGERMPGATCGLWGVCGSVTSIGAALAIIDGTGPLSADTSWGKHMEFTSKALAKLGAAGGPRCCKRDAFLSMETAVDYINENYDVALEKSEITCEFYPSNKQCIRNRCPYHSESGI